MTVKEDELVLEVQSSRDCIVDEIVEQVRKSVKFCEGRTETLS